MSVTTDGNTQARRRPCGGERWGKETHALSAPRYLILSVQCLVALCCALLAGTVVARTIEIPSAGISDHGNPYLEGSIAQWFLRGKQGARYVLTDSAESYQLKHSLYLPRNSILQSAPGMRARLVANGQLKWMIVLSSGTSIRNLDIDANGISQSAIYGRGTDNIQLRKNVISNSLSSLTPLQCAENEIRTHLVSIWDSKGIRVNGNRIENSGLPPVGSPQSACAVKSNSLSLKNSTHVEVLNNRITRSASGGIDITDSIFVTIDSNHIEGSGANRLYYGSGDSAKASDGIVGYANPMRRPITNFYRVITNNTIVDWANHGIHVSGRMHLIKGNRIVSPSLPKGMGGHALYVGDRPQHLGGIQCSSYVWLENNTLQSANDAIWLDYYDSARVWLSDNIVQSGRVGRYNPGCTRAEW